MLRTRTSAVDYLVLGDGSLVLDQGKRVEVVTDLQVRSIGKHLRKALASSMQESGRVDSSLVRQLEEAKRRHVNRPGGYWIAAATPEAAHHAIIGTVPLVGPDRLRRAALLTDGASRAVDTFNLMDWPQLLDVLDLHGPAHLISLVRQAERSDTGAARQKRHDDATAAYCRLPEEPQ